MIVATWQDHELEIVDTYRTGGIVYAVCHAIDGSEPFVGGDKWPVRTDWGNVPVCHLDGIQQVDEDACTCNPNFDCPYCAARYQARRDQETEYEGEY